MEHRMFDLTGMTALVTGAAGGIGSAISHALARQGARLALSGTNPSKLRSFREELNDTYGHDHVEITCDLSNTEQVEHLIPATVDTLGKIDILVNNAGITRDNLAMRMKPGATQFTVMPRLATSWPSDLDIPTSPALAAA